MQTIEIRQNKKKVIPTLVLLAIVLIAATYYIYFSGEFDNNNAMKILYVFLTASLLYAIYIPTRKLLKNESVLTFSKSEIEINEKGKPVSFLWIQVINWKIEKDENTYYLVIETTDVKKKINISWLDKSLTK
jgi:hypothetical protein